MAEPPFKAARAADNCFVFIIFISPNVYRPLHFRVLRVPPAIHPLLVHKRVILIIV
jgi:hypothetical protein